MKFTLANGTQVQAGTEQLLAEVLGTRVGLSEPSGNPVVAVERRDGDAQVAQYITFIEDMGVLQELLQPDVTAARRTELQALARKWGLDPLAADFSLTLAKLRTGGEAMGPSAMVTTLGPEDVHVPADLQAEQYRAQLLQQLEQWRVLQGQVASAPDVNDDDDTINAWRDRSTRPR